MQKTEIANQTSNFQTAGGTRVTSTRILARNVRASNDTWATGLNNNDLLVGPSGSNKTRGYVIPNILHAQDSLIVADTKGNLCNLYGKYLEDKGYKVLHLNFADVAKTPWGYNPLNYVRICKEAEKNANGDFYMEQDIKKIAAAICPIQHNCEPMWDYQARRYLEAFLLYIMNWLPKKQHTLYEAYRFLSKMEDEDFATMLDEECMAYPNSAFALKYRSIKDNKTAEKMDASIKGILAQHLDAISYSGTKRMFEMKKQVRFEEFLKGKVALFLDVSDSDRSQDKLVNLFYTQALQFLMNAADRRPDSRLPIPVRFILDDFSTNTKIPDFDGIISVIRSREIYVSLVIQSISQLEGLYEHAKAQTIINNCDHCLYLGGTDVQTAEYFGKKFNCPASTILNLPLDSMVLFVRGKKPVKVRRYELKEDEAYLKLTGQAEEAEKRAAADTEAMSENSVISGEAKK